MLRRSAAAAFGLTIVGSASTALGATKAKLAVPVRMDKEHFAALVKAAKKEGHLNTIALPPDWANYGEALHNFPRKYGIGITNDNPNGSSAQENEAIRSLKNDKRAPDAVDVGISFAISGANEGLYAKYFNQNYKTIPRSLKDTRGYWMGDYWGAVSIGYNKSLVPNPPKTFADLKKPEYKGKVAINGSPLSSNSAVSVVIASALANGGSLSDVSAGIDYWAQLKKSGNYIPVQTTPQTVASGQTPISLDWDYNNLAYVKEFPAANWGFTVPADGVYGGAYAQAVSAYAPHPNAARLWEEFLYSDQGQIIWLKGGAHPARFADLVARKVIPKAVLASLPSSAIYTKVKFASIGQQTKAKTLIAQQWPTKVGS
jgi:putative spermidine/putrescine transport system substrate-binding protein